MEDDDENMPIADAAATAAKIKSDLASASKYKDFFSNSPRSAINSRLLKCVAAARPHALPVSMHARCLVWSTGI